jgi:hypothetical protein
MNLLVISPSFQSFKIDKNQLLWGIRPLSGNLSNLEAAPPAQPCLIHVFLSSAAVHVERQQGQFGPGTEIAHQLSLATAAFTHEDPTMGISVTSKLGFRSTKEWL